MDKHYTKKVIINVNLIDEVCKRIINNKNFKIEEWCEWDAKRLIKCGNMILRELKLGATQ